MWGRARWDGAWVRNGSGRWAWVKAWWWGVVGSGAGRGVHRRWFGAWVYRYHQGGSTSYRYGADRGQGRTGCRRHTRPRRGMYMLGHAEGACWTGWAMAVSGLVDWQPRTTSAPFALALAPHMYTHTNYTSSPSPPHRLSGSVKGWVGFGLRVAYRRAIGRFVPVAPPPSAPRPSLLSPRAAASAPTPTRTPWSRHTTCT